METKLSCLVSMFETAGAESEDVFDHVLQFLRSVPDDKRQQCCQIAALFLSSHTYCDFLAVLKQTDHIEEMDLPIFQPCRPADDSEQVSALSELMTNSVYTCRKCGSKRVKVTTRQTRSADEGMTEFICCVDCGFVRKTNS
jgi:hypothetical protein